MLCSAMTNEELLTHMKMRGAETTEEYELADRLTAAIDEIDALTQDLSKYMECVDGDHTRGQGQEVSQEILD